MSRSKNYGDKNASQYFKGLDRKNIYKRKYAHDLYVAHVAGVVSGLFEVLNNNKKNPGDLESVIADIVMDFTKASRELQIANSYKKPVDKLLDIEDVMEFMK